ncbi:MAG TPA: LysR family transcriptional regulator [Kocuria sp.]|nr:LysR substrate-binding domain-containing protein [Kocuria rhizophila]HBH56044.1 LysR family transcriptional regulator [Kocuria sp.]
MSTPFTLVQLRYFVEAARSGNMTAAARRLHVSQPAMSSAINQLENDLGVKLFTRVPRKGVRLTRNGRHFFDDAEELLARAASVAEKVGRSPALVGEKVKVGIYLPVAPFQAPRLLQRFVDRYPGISVEIFEVDHDELTVLLQRNEIDLAISYSLTPFEGMVVESLQEVPPHLVVPATHRLARRREPIDLREVAEETLILLDLPYTAGYYSRVLRAAGVEPEVRFRLRGYETVRGMVARGFGVTIFNQRIRHDLVYDGDAVRALELLGAHEPMVIQLVRPQLVASSAVDAFAATCREVFGSTKTAMSTQDDLPAI